MKDTALQAWRRWWDDEGSAMRPLPNEDTEQFARRMTEIAWSNGAFKRLADVDLLRAELAAAIKQRDEARRDACIFEVIADFNKKYPTGCMTSELARRLARIVADEKEWDCFAQQERGGA